MHRWIRHPLRAVTVLAPPGQDLARRPRGAGGASAFPRCRDLHGAPRQLSERDCFPSQLLRASEVPPAPLLLVPLVPARGHLWTQVSLCIRGCKNVTEHFSSGLCLLEECMALVLGCPSCSSSPDRSPFRHGRRGLVASWRAARCCKEDVCAEQGSPEPRAAPCAHAKPGAQALCLLAVFREHI